MISAQLCEGTVFLRPSNDGWEPPPESGLRKRRSGDFSVALDQALDGQRGIDLTAVLRVIDLPLLDFEGEITLVFWMARPDGAAVSSIQLDGGDPLSTVVQEIWVEVEAPEDGSDVEAPDRVTVIASPGAGRARLVVDDIVTADSWLRQVRLRKAFTSALSISPEVSIELAARRGIAGIVMGREMLNQLADRNGLLSITSV